MTSPGAETLQGKSILVAEDNALTRRMICELLAAHGAKAFPAEDGVQAVRMFAAADEGAFDAVILDEDMPQMDGYAAARAIRKTGRRDARRLLIFAHSDVGTQYGAREAAESGMDGCLQKPVRMQVLARLLDCARNHAQDE